MAELEALYLVAAAVLLVAGLAKLRSPEPTAAALATAGLPGSVPLVRGLGAAELAVGAAALAFGGRLAALVLALTYAAVTAVAWRQRSVGADCGCFGAHRAPVTGIHIGVNLSAVVVAGLAALTIPAGLPVVVADAPWWGLPTLAALALSAVLVQTLLTVLPDLSAARRLHTTEVQG